MTPTIITSISDGAAAIVGAIGETITTLIANPTVIVLVGLAIGYGVVKYVLGMLPMLRNR